MKKILFSLLMLSLYAQESSDSSDDERVPASTLAQRIEDALPAYARNNPRRFAGEGAAASTSAQAAKRYECPYRGCTKSYLNKNVLARHKYMHTLKKEHACTYQGCGRIFANSSDLKYHSLSHPYEKPFGCLHPGCDKSFTLAKNLKRHMQTHTNTYPAMPAVSSPKRQRLESDLDSDDDSEEELEIDTEYRRG